MSIAQMSLYGGVIILLIAIARTLWRDKLPGKVFSILWVVALVRLLVPFSIPSSVSVYTLFGKCRPILEKKAELLLEQWGTEVSSQTVQNSPILQSGSGGMKLNFLWQTIWLIGVLMCAGYFIFTYFRCYREFRTALPVEEAYIQDWKRVHPLRRKLSVRQSDRITSPLTYGIFKPVILIPASMKLEAEKTVSYILEHEYVHIQRWDVVFKLLMIIVLCLHWFNPLVWLMYLLFNRDLELSCDEIVVRRFGKGSEKEYAMLLLEMAEKQSKAVPIYCSFGKHPLEERITSIMKKRQITRVSGVFAGVLIMGIAVMFTTSADSVKESDNPIMRGEEIGENEDSKPSLPTKEQVGNGNEYNEETKAAAEAEVIRVDAEIRRELQQVNEWLAENGEERNVGLAEELVTLDEEIQKALGTLEK